MNGEGEIDCDAEMSSIDCGIKKSRPNFTRTIILD
jgi:hypothetical protein